MKKFKLVAGKSGDPNVVAAIDWDLCFLCQRVTPEALQCPNDTKRSDKGAGYKSVASSLLQFSELGDLPTPVRLSRLDEGNGIEATLSTHNAKWHKSCRNMYNKTKLDRAIQRKSQSVEDCGESSLDAAVCSERLTRSSTALTGSVNTVCLICDGTDVDGQLHAVTTFDVDRRVRSCAHTLQDSKLLSKLSVGDLMAVEAHYHARCLVSLYNRALAVEKQDSPTERVSSNDSLAFAQLVEYMSDCRRDNSTAAVFVLSELAKKYQNRLKQLGVSCDSRVNTTKLKNRLLSHFPGMRAQLHGKEVLLVFSEDIGDALSTACQVDSDLDALHLVKAAEIVRRDIFNMSYKFNGTFPIDCQENSVPQSLIALVKMILEGPNIDNQSDCTVKSTPAAMSVSQLLVFNTVKHVRKPSDSAEPCKLRHNTSQETPLPLYLSMMVHAETRKRDLVDKLFHLGLCVSYDRLLQLSAGLANRTCDSFDVAAGLCPPYLQNGLFTTAAVDNIDHNPRSTTAVDSFHGTGISLIQHHCEEEGMISGFAGGDVDDVTDYSKTLKSLPQSYTSISPVGAIRKDVSLPDVTLSFAGDLFSVEIALNEETKWLEKVNVAIEKGDSEPTTLDISWAAYHASISHASNSLTDVCTLLPLFHDAAHSPAMICHAMKIVRSAVHSVNPGQIPVLTMDQPLYSLGKLIQWNWPDRYGESNFLLMLGGLHTEMAVLKALGSWLDGSGWTTALVNAHVTSAGKADSMLHVSHVTRTRHAHQVTAACLYILLQHAYLQYMDRQNTDQAPVLLFNEWCQNQCVEHPQFQYWYIAFQLELAMLTFVRSIRQSDFTLYTEALSHLVPWFFALNHHHYARWVSVHCRDLRTLDSIHPDTARELMAGKFTVRKTKRQFSAIAIDHAHEQLNARVKGIGGAVGLTENTQALLRWTVAGPEISRVVSEFEQASFIDRLSQELCHHEQTPAQQSAFLTQVSALVTTFKEMGNPFLDDGAEMYAIDTHKVCSSDAVQTVRTIEALGREQHNRFVKERLIERTISVTAPISRNKIPLFREPAVKIKQPLHSKLATARNDCALFASLYIACQTRNGDLDTFFAHENQPNPPALSSDGNIRFGCKSDLLNCLETLVASKQDCASVDAVVLDGAAIVQMLHPIQCRTFDDYSTKVFVPYILSQLGKVSRVDLVWDQYVPRSLKATARAKRGFGVHRKVVPNGDLPRNWADFLHNDENKKELFHFLSMHLLSNDIGNDKKLVVTDGFRASGCHIHVSSELDPCSHEEADTRMLLHVAHIASTGLNKVMIRTVDTDVVVLAIAFFQRLSLSELWVAIGTGKYLRYMAIHDLASSLGSDQSYALPFFHAFTGCDTVSCFTGRGKKTAWETWKTFPDVTPAFVSLSSQPADVRPVMPTIERFVVLMYDRSSNKVTVNDLRKHLFTKKGRSMEGLPPTEAALLQHTKRATFQSGYCWQQSLRSQQELPNPSDWGWIWEDENGLWKPLWTTFSEIAQCCPELIKCSCKKVCSKRCKCAKAKMKCTALCFCDGTCSEAT